LPGAHICAHAFSPEKRPDSRYIANSGATRLIASNTSKRLWMEILYIFISGPRVISNAYQMTYSLL